MVKPSTASNKSFETNLEDKPKKLVPPDLPPLGAMVDFYTRAKGRQYHGNEGPYVAQVVKVNHGLDAVPAKGDVPAIAAVPGSVSLQVQPSGIASYTVENVTGAFEDDEHDYQDWWQSPEKK